MIHWQQLIATMAAAATIAAGAAAVYFPTRRRREERLAARVVERDTALRATISAEFVAQSEQIKADMIARIDQSDRATSVQVAEVKASVSEIAEKARAVELQMATQFGGNGGGIRQAINEHGQQLAALVGRFEQHLAEVTR